MPDHFGLWTLGFGLLKGIWIELPAETMGSRVQGYGARGLTG